MEQQDSQRDSQGRFSVGNQYARCRKADQLKQALLSAVAPSDIEAIVAMLIDKAKGGDTRAAALLLDRVLGKPAVNKTENIVAVEDASVEDDGEIVFDDGNPEELARMEAELQASFNQMQGEG